MEKSLAAFPGQDSEENSPEKNSALTLPTESVGVYESTELVGVYTVDLPTKPV